MVGRHGLVAVAMQHVFVGPADDGQRVLLVQAMLGQRAALDALLHEPLGVALNRLPLSDRIYGATVKRSGPYAGALQVARALEGGDTKTLRTVCRALGMQVEEVNRQLLRTLVAARW